MGTLSPLVGLTAGVAGCVVLMGLEPEAPLCQPSGELLVVTALASAAAVGYVLQLEPPSKRYQGSWVGAGLAAGSAVGATGYVLIRPLVGDDAVDVSPLEAYVRVGTAVAVIGTATVLGYRYGPGARWDAVEVAPATGAAGSVGMRLAVRF